jgi:hypothetical protein
MGKVFYANQPQNPRGWKPEPKWPTIDWRRLAEINNEIRRVRTDIWSERRGSAVVKPVGGEIFGNRSSMHMP